MYFYKPDDPKHPRLGGHVHAIIGAGKNRHAACGTKIGGSLMDEPDEGEPFCSACLDAINPGRPKFRKLFSALQDKLLSCITWTPTKLPPPKKALKPLDGQLDLF